MKKTTLCCLTFSALLLAGCGRQTEYTLDLDAARKVNMFPGETYLHEFGDTNGPFRCEGGTQGNPGQSVTFFTVVDGRRVEWTAPPVDAVSFAAQNFENQKGNGFVVVHRIDEKNRQQ